MAKILIIYSTTDGHTQKIGLRLKQVIENSDHQVELVPVENAHAIDLDLFDKIVVGASVRYGKHHTKVYQLIIKNSNCLDSKPSALETEPACSICWKNRFSEISFLGSPCDEVDHVDQQRSDRSQSKHRIHRLDSSRRLWVHY